MTRNDLVFVTRDARFVKVDLLHQPTTDDIQNLWCSEDRYVLQLIGGLFYVYDTATIRRSGPITTIGLPVFHHEDFDVAKMWAVLNV